MFKKYYEKLFKQIAIDYNCTPEYLKKGEIIITKSEWNDGRRSYSPDMPFLQLRKLWNSVRRRLRKSEMESGV